MVDVSRRWLMGGIAAAVAAPAIVRIASIMPVRGDRLTLADIDPLKMRAQMAGIYKGIIYFTPSPFWAMV